ncbi:MAG: helix-hairpin-helix domain-containing protein [Gemmatimonadota bacterium]|nr:helix-hairpin-helix domain-containing protein [Gemmatimonadota bacterium]
MKWLDTPRAYIASLALVATTGCTADTAKTADTAAAGMETAASAAAVPSTSDTAAPGAAAAPSAAGTTSSSGMLDPNSASRADLAAIPGMTVAVITAAIAARPYTSMVAFDKVVAANLNEKQRDSVYARVWRPIDLNTATGEEILLIPGVGPRMRHEFEEYRPYTSIEQFRREIGKYVDRNEVARLERYVTIR